MNTFHFLLDSIGGFRFQELNLGFFMYMIVTGSWNDPHHLRYRLSPGFIGRGGIITR